MFCPKCGNNLKDGAKFCPKCGTKIIPAGDAKKTDVAPQKPESSDENKGSHNKKRVIPIAVAAGMVTVAVAAFAGVLIYNKISEPLETVSISNHKEDETEAGTESDSIAEDITTDIEDIFSLGGGSKSAETTAATQAAAATTEAATTEALPVVVTPDSVTFRLLEEVPDMSHYQRVGVARAGSTSNIVQKGNQNGPEMVLDGDETTSWQEGVDGPGIGQIIYYELDQEQPISYLSFKLGNWRNDEYYYSNNRPRTLTITLNDYTFQVTFPAGKKEYFVEINPPYPSSYIEFRIDEVYQGSRYDDTCIAEIGMYCRTGDQA